MVSSVDGFIAATRQLKGQNWGAARGNFGGWREEVQKLLRWRNPRRPAMRVTAMQKFRNSLGEEASCSGAWSEEASNGGAGQRGGSHLSGEDEPNLYQNS